MRALLLLTAAFTTTGETTSLTTAETPSLDDRIGQLLMVGFRGATLEDDAAILDDIAHRNLGGVVLFEKGSRNIRNPEQVAELVGKLRSAASTPLLVAVDQEGGYVRRLRDDFGLSGRSSARYLGELDQLPVTRRHATETARTLASLGFNLNLGPVVDLDVNPDSPAIGRHARSYGRDSDRVVRHAREFILGHHELGVLTALKHFPGHGSARGDTHHGITDVTATWSPAELEPFRALVHEGAVDVIMTSHVYNAQLDKAQPATLSRKTIHGVLREQLGYDGVVISDDLQMGAIRSGHDLERSIELALGAGVDILVFANNGGKDVQIVERVIGLIRGMVESGRLSEADIDRAYQRVQRLKQKLR